MSHAMSDTTYNVISGISDGDVDSDLDNDDSNLDNDNSDCLQLMVR